MSIVFDCLLKPWIHEMPGPSNTVIQASPKTDDSWSLVSLKQRDFKSGKFKTLSTGDFIHYRFLMNDRTKQLYLIDKTERLSYRSLKAIDCFIVLSLLNPLHFVGTVIWNFARIFYDITAVALNALSNLIKAFQNQSVWLALRNNLREAGNEFTSRLKEDVVNIGRAAYYATGIEIAALEGFLFDSFKGLANMAIIGRDWNHNKPHHYHIGAFENYPDLKEPRTFDLGYFIARCAGNLDEDKPENRSLKRWELVEQIKGDLQFKDYPGPRINIPVLPLFAFAVDYFKRRQEAANANDFEEEEEFI